jgi:hypothetical protein
VRVLLAYDAMECPVRVQSVEIKVVLQSTKLMIDLSNILSAKNVASSQMLTLR